MNDGARAPVDPLQNPAQQVLAQTNTVEQMRQSQMPLVQSQIRQVNRVRSGEAREVVGPPELFGPSVEEGWSDWDMIRNGTQVMCQFILWMHLNPGTWFQSGAGFRPSRQGCRKRPLV